MKNIITILLLLFAVPSYAQCVAEVKGAKVGVGNSILVGIEYTLNGIAEPNIDWITYYPEIIKGKTKNEKLLMLKADADKRCEQIILNKYIKENAYPLEEYRGEIVAVEIDKVKDVIVGLTSTVSSTNVEIDTDGDSINDKQVEIGSDGQKNITDISN